MLRRLLPVLALAGCIDAEPTRTTDQTVIGGSPSNDGEYPAVGSLWAGGSACTGTLIRPDVVLTAAHCIEPAFLGDEIPGFTLANDTISVPPPVVAGVRYVQHELFDIEVEPAAGLGEFHDIGLLWLAEPITTTDPMRVATPTEAEASLIAGLELELVGYGRTSNEGFDYGVKHDAIAELVAFNATELQISPGGGAPQNCHGDSGGPAIVDFGDGPRVVGVVSRSAAAKTDCDDGGIDTRSDAYHEWILDQLGEEPEPTPDAGVPAPDAGGPAVEGDGAGCCSSGGGGGAAGALLLGALVLGVLIRRGRDPAAGADPGRFC